MTDIVERAKNVLIRVQKNQGATKEFADRDAVLAHVENEFVLASQEAPSVAKRRLEALANTIEVVKGVSWEGTTAVKIPVFEEKTTTKNDKTDKPGALSKERTPADFSDWGKSVEKRLEALGKSDGDPSENEEAEEPKPGKKGKKDVGKRGADDGWPADLAAPGGSNDDNWGSEKQ
jgi:hypothetical protein